MHSDWLSYWCTRDRMLVHWSMKNNAVCFRSKGHSDRDVVGAVFYFASPIHFFICWYILCIYRSIVPNYSSFIVQITLVTIWEKNILSLDTLFHNIIFHFLLSSRNLAFSLKCLTGRVFLSFSFLNTTGTRIFLNKSNFSPRELRKMVGQAFGLRQCVAYEKFVMLSACRILKIKDMLCLLRSSVLR